MTPGVFTEFLARCGYQTQRIKEDFYAYSRNRYFWLSYPYHTNEAFTAEELDDLYSRSRWVGMLHFGPPAAEKAEDSYYVGIRQREYDLDSLSGNLRHNTRRGLKRCTVRPIDFEFLHREGKLLQVDTLRRQKRDERLFDEEEWRRWCQAATDLPGFEAWGAFTEDELAAFLIVFRMGRSYQYILQRSLSKHLRAYPNNAVTFAVTRELLGRPDVDVICYGLNSLHAPPTLDNYKVAMGFERIPISKRVAIHPRYRLLVNRHTASVARRVLDMYEGEQAKKISSILRMIQ